jgi:hypothetical protein
MRFISAFVDRARRDVVSRDVMGGEDLRAVQLYL